MPAVLHPPRSPRALGLQCGHSSRRSDLLHRRHIGCRHHRNHQHLCPTSAHRLCHPLTLAPDFFAHTGGRCAPHRLAGDRGTSARRQPGPVLTSPPTRTTQGPPPPATKFPPSPSSSALALSPEFRRRGPVSTTAGARVQIPFLPCFAAAGKVWTRCSEPQRSVYI